MPLHAGKIALGGLLRNNLYGLINKPHRRESSEPNKRPDLMALFLLLGWCCYVVSCSNARQVDDSASTSKSSVASKKDCSSLEPANPYEEGTGHYAGFKWAEEGKSCGIESNSFTEGCEDFEDQEEAYNSCLAK